MRRNKPFTSKQIEQFKILYQKGIPVREIAKKFNTYHSAILYFLDKLNVKRRSRSKAAKLGVKFGRIKIFKHKIPKSSKKLSLEKAYVLGTLYGDGNIYCNNKLRTNQIALAATDKEFVDNFRNSLFKTYKIKPTKELRIRKIKNRKKQYVTRLCSKEACKDFLKYGLTGTRNWRVPNNIKKNRLETKAQFIKGFFDSEGNVDKNRVSAFSTNKKGIEEIREILIDFGIRSKIVTKKNKKPRVTSYRLGIQDRKSVEIFHKHINFTIIRKKGKLKEIVNNYKLWTTPSEEVKKLKPKMLELRNKNLTYKQIGKELNVGIATVWNHLKQ